MQHIIHTITTSSGQTITHVTNGYYKYEYAVLKAGRSIDKIRAELQRTIDAPARLAAQYEAEGFFDFDFTSHIKYAKRAQKELDALAGIPAGTFYWEKASWHADGQLAVKAARGNKSLIFKTTITEK